MERLGVATGNGFIGCSWISDHDGHLRVVDWLTLTGLSVDTVLSSEATDG